MRHFLIGTLAVCVFLSSLSGQTEAPDPYQGIDWQATLDGALKKAKKENRPLMVAFILRGETANESICGDHFVDERLVKLSREFVCMLAYAEHVYGDNKGDTRTSEAYVNSFAHRVSRKQLAKLEYAARGEYMDAGEVSAPQFIFVHPNGEKVLLRHIWLLSTSELRKKMHKALHYFDSNHALPEEVAVEAAADLEEIKELLVTANDNNMNVRRKAMNRVAVKDHPMVIDFLIKQTGKDVDQSRRLEAIRAMGQNGQVKYLPRLHKLLAKERSVHVRTNIASAIGDVGLIESIEPMLKTLKRAKKKNLRSILIQSIMDCGAYNPGVKKMLAKTLSSGSDLDQITILYRLANSTWNDTYMKPIKKCMRSTNAQVRAAAYFVLGSHQRKDMVKKIKSKLSSEKSIARNACAWTLKELGQKIEGTPKSPSGALSSLLPSASY